MLGIFIFYDLLLILSEKNPAYQDSNSRPNVSEGYEVSSELLGRPVATEKSTSQMRTGNTRHNSKRVRNFSLSNKRVLKDEITS